MTNRDYLLNLDDYELAEHLIQISRQDNDGNDIGSEWFIYEDAIEATMDWLNKEVNE